MQNVVLKSSFCKFILLLILNCLISLQVPDSIPNQKRKEFVKNLADIRSAYAGELFDELEKTPHGRCNSDCSDHLVFAPPTRFCYQCASRKGTKKKLSIHNPATQVRYFGLDVAEKRQKICLKCDSCNINYNLCHYGNKDNFRLYDEKRDIVEVTDGVIVSRSLFERYVNSQ